jgi:hypothetical protein
MLVVRRELERIQRALTLAETPKCHAELYAAQQALVWVLDPEIFNAPHDMLTGSSQQDLRGCPEGNYRSAFSDSPDPHVVGRLPIPISPVR